MDSQTRFNQALALFREEKVTEAIETLEALLEKDPAFEDAYEALGVLYARMNRLDEAVEIAKKWIRLNPHALMAHTNLSRFYVAKGMIAEAEHEQAEARRLSWIEELRKKKMALPKVDLHEKIERFKKVIELDPNDVLGYYTLGETYLEAGAYREAIEVFTKGVAVNPKHSSSYLGLGQAYEGVKELAKAGETYRKGMAVAEGEGDVMPQKKMEARLAKLGKA